ncbi:MAG TPA: hypothetical protein VK968_09555 [Roseimicrobium sp.]|nr:hypothetical protein [Roseimicrobium sp.]
MARPKEDLFTRLARHTNHSAESLREFIDTSQVTCLNWQGATRRVNHIRYPHLKGIGNPARLLFAYIFNIPVLDKLTWLRSNCGNPDCINPRHFNPQGTYSLYHDRVGVVPTLANYDEDNVVDILAMLEEGADPAEVEGWSPPNDWKEAEHRRKRSG